MPNKDKTKCLLCGSEKMIESVRINSEKVIGAYKAARNLNVGKFFPENYLSSLRCVECDLQMYWPALIGDDDFYSALYSNPSFYENEKPEFQYALESLLDIKPEKVLDVGCGSGKFLSKIKDGFVVRGIERNPDAASLLQRRGISLDSESESYDFIVTFQVIEHVDDVSGFLDSIMAKLRPGGHLLITVPNRNSKYFTEVFDMLDYPPHHITQWSRKALEYVARKHSLNIVDYFEEPHRIEHYLTLMRSRRDRVLKNARYYNVIRRFFMVFDMFYAPFAIDNVKYSGHTHGMLYKK